MTELPTSKMGFGDVLWAMKGQGAHGRARRSADGRRSSRCRSAPRRQPASITASRWSSNFFPGTKVLASELMEHIVRHLIGPADVTRATVFDDQYISTGGQFYELIVGHDRFNADLRPHFYRLQGSRKGSAAIPTTAPTMLIAEEAGVVITDGWWPPLDGPLDVTTGLSWAAYANETLRQKIEPIVTAFLR